MKELNTKKILIHTILSGILLLAIACQTTIIRVEGQMEVDESRTPDAQEQYESVVLGIVELSEPMEAHCQTATDKVVMRMDPMDSLIHFFLGGVYSTRTISVYCLSN